MGADETASWLMWHYMAYAMDHTSIFFIAQVN